MWQRMLTEEAVEDLNMRFDDRIGMIGLRGDVLVF